MVFYKLVEDNKSGKVFKEYYLTQGDTFQNQLEILDGKGEKIDPALIDNVVFKLSDISYKEEYVQPYIYDVGVGKWIITIPSEITYTWEITKHIYEFQVTYLSGVVSTPIQAKFVVLNQIQGEGV